MPASEFSQILSALILLTAITSIPNIALGNWSALAPAFFFAVLILGLSIGAKKLTAYSLDADVEHELWKVYQYGFSPGQHFKREMPAGIIIPLLGTLLSLGSLPVMTLLTYETRAKKYRAAKRHGYYSYTEMTDWHNALISSAGIIIVLLLALILYFLPYSNLEYFAKISALYAFFNLLPISKLDGTQIFFGSRVLYSVLALITLIFAIYALIL